METLLQGRKADATNRSVGFSDSLNGIENYKVIFKYDIDSLKSRERKIATGIQMVLKVKKIIKIIVPITLHLDKK